MWTVLLTAEAAAELAALPVDQRARFNRVRALTEENGLETVRFPLVRHIDGPIWEIRLHGRDGISRALYVTRIGQHVVVVRVFTKKTEQTPRREIELAMKRAKEIR